VVCLFHVNNRLIYVIYKTQYYKNDLERNVRKQHEMQKKIFAKLFAKDEGNRPERFALKVYANGTHWNTVMHRYLTH
jgi:hypothetical protein